MDRAFVGNVQQLASLFFRQPTCKMNVPFDPVQHSFFGFALGTVAGVNFRVAKMNGNFLERPVLAASVHSDRH